MPANAATLNAEHDHDCWPTRVHAMGEALDGVGSQLHAPDALLPGKSPPPTD